ncbi:MAG TPA: hypothetical protein VEF33_12425, partial [Syntrophales bacterium]|nr:hypothetical protein [Syntrophales bacterium]
DTKIDWSTDACDTDSTTDPITKKAVIPRCKTEWSSSIPSTSSTYLMDTKENPIYIPEFITVYLLNLGNGYGLVLYSDGLVLHMLLEFDKDGRCLGKYIINGTEFLINPERTGLYCKGLLMWYGGQTRQLDTCAQDLLKSMGEIPDADAIFPFHGGFPSPINVITLPQSITGLASPPSRDDGVAKLIDENISRVVVWVKKEHPDILGSASFAKSLFVFLAENSSNNKMLSSLVHKYKDYLGKEILARYASTKSCK